MLSGLAKYDGSISRLLNARELHQIAGRAGRAGYDTSGLVVVQAPDHVIENEQAPKKVAGDAAPDTQARQAEAAAGLRPLGRGRVRTSSSPHRPSPSCPISRSTTPRCSTSSTVRATVARRWRGSLRDNDEPRAGPARTRPSGDRHLPLAPRGGSPRAPREPDEQGRRIRVTRDLQADFALDSPLSPFVLEAVPHLEPSSPTWPLDVMSVVEATLDNPGPVLIAQLDRVKTEAMAALKAAGVEYEERIEALDKLEYPKPLRDWTYDLFDAYRIAHPWAADFTIRPKSVARDLFERAMTFSEYVAHYGLTRSEGLVLRYLSDVYKGLVRTVPET